jgi:hypothetical protein
VRGNEYIRGHRYSWLSRCYSTDVLLVHYFVTFEFLFKRFVFLIRSLVPDMVLRQEMGHLDERIAEKTTHFCATGFLVVLFSKVLRCLLVGTIHNNR